jgi:hypothetical protein
MRDDRDIEKLLVENLLAIMDYRKGSKNLEEAKENLRRSGFEDEAIEKVLKNMDRKNIIKFPSKNNYEN